MRPAKYLGRPWRSRFLRSPKVALELADRPDFVALDQLATARLGLKTGCDEFFFVRAVEPEKQARGVPGSVFVRGIKGWTGYISRRDLLPAALNPHRLLGDKGRQLLIPGNGKDFYLHPAAGSARAGLADYVKAGERFEVHKRRLVQSNADANRWYLQSRGIVTARWALPYNSAYDYGASDNRVGAVLNGRFVGVDPLSDVDPDLLGAALNSTFVILTRLLEGTTTGVEGAYDVGPPAVRRMCVPDIRRIPDRLSEPVRAALNDLRGRDLMPPAPSRTAAVDPRRHTLDLALMEGLGCSRGEASALCSAAYQSYARWRTAVEDVEAQMRIHRRAMHRRGQARTMQATELAARRVWEELSPTVRMYPSDLLTTEMALESVDVARTYKLPPQEPLFGAGLVPTTTGGEVDLGSFPRVRYAAWLLSLGFEPPLQIPLDPVRATAIVDAFQWDADWLEKSAAERARLFSGDELTLAATVQVVRRLWMRACRDGGMVALPGGDQAN